MALVSVGVDVRQAETLNRLARQLGQSSVPNPEARKSVWSAFAACQTSLKKFVSTTKNVGEGPDRAQMKKTFKTDLAKTQTALNEVREIAAMLPDNSAMLLPQSSLVILTSAQLVE